MDEKFNKRVHAIIQGRIARNEPLRLEVKDSSSTKNGDVYFVPEHFYDLGPYEHTGQAMAFIQSQVDRAFYNNHLRNEPVFIELGGGSGVVVVPGSVGAYDELIDDVSDNYEIDGGQGIYCVVVRGLDIDWSKAICDDAPRLTTAPIDVGATADGFQAPSFL